MIASADSRLYRRRRLCSHSPLLASVPIGTGSALEDAVARHAPGHSAGDVVAPGRLLDHRLAPRTRLHLQAVQSALRGRALIAAESGQLRQLRRTDLVQRRHSLLSARNASLMSPAGRAAGSSRASPADRCSLVHRRLQAGKPAVGPVSEDPQLRHRKRLLLSCVWCKHRSKLLSARLTCIAWARACYIMPSSPKHLLHGGLDAVALLAPGMVPC